MKNKTKVLLADDHPIFRDGLKKALLKYKEIEIVALASNGKEAIQILEKQAVDVIVCDLEMPLMDGLECIQRINKLGLKVKILVISMHQEMVIINKLLSTGVSGYISKTCEVEELLNAIKIVAKGEQYLSNAVTASLLKYNQNQSTLSADLNSLSKREKEILTLIAEELSTPEIADKLFLSINTIESHRKSLMIKLRKKNMVGLVKFALNSGLIDDKKAI